MEEDEGEGELNRRRRGLGDNGDPDKAHHRFPFPAQGPGHQTPQFNKTALISRRQPAPSSGHQRPCSRPPGTHAVPCFACVLVEVCGLRFSHVLCAVGFMRGSAACALDGQLPGRGALPRVVLLSLLGNTPTHTDVGTCFWGGKVEMDVEIWGDCTHTHTHTHTHTCVAACISLPTTLQRHHCHRRRHM